MEHRNSNNGFLAFAALFVVVALVGLGVLFFKQHTGLAVLLHLSAFALGVNTVTYEWPVTGVTAPTAAQSAPHQQVVATITGDGAATSFTVTHNWGLTAVQLASGVFPEVEYEYLLAAGYTAAALVGTKGTNDVSFTNTAFTGAGLRVRLKRPFSKLR